MSPERALKEAVGRDTVRALIGRLRLRMGADLPNPFEKIDLHDELVDGLDLAGLDLRRANFERAMLFGSSLSKSDLRQASLSHAYARSLEARDADFRGANLMDANLTRADLQGARFDSDTTLLGTRFDQAELMGCDFRGAGPQYMRGAHLDGADFEGAELIYADFRDADFGKAKIKGAFVGRGHKKPEEGWPKAHTFGCPLGIRLACEWVEERGGFRVLDWQAP